MSFAFDENTSSSTGFLLLIVLLGVLTVVALVAAIAGIGAIFSKADRKLGLWMIIVGLPLTVVFALSFNQTQTLYKIEPQRFAQAFEDTYGVELVKETFVRKSGLPVIPSPDEPSVVLLSKDGVYYTTTITFVKDGNEWTALAPAGSVAKLTSLDKAFATGTLAAEEPLSSDR